MVVVTDPMYMLITSAPPTVMSAINDGAFGNPVNNSSQKMSHP
jgi:hypothetical protein